MSMHDNILISIPSGSAMIYQTSHEMSCYEEGMHGNCGVNCSVFTRGSCENISEFDPEELFKKMQFHHNTEYAKNTMECYEVCSEWLKDYMDKHPEEFI